MVSVDATACIRCGACVRGCPMGVLVLGETSAEVHPRRRCIACMHCAAACPKNAIHFTEYSDDEVYPAMPEDPLEKLLVTRRSIRHYQDRLPEKAVIEKALHLANYAPSGKNQRAYRYTVVWGKTQVARLRDLCLGLCREFGEAPELPKLFEKGTDLLTCGAPCMIVAWSPDDCLNPVLDPAVAMAQLELLLVRDGLATCWGGYLHQVSDRFPEIREHLGIPAGCRVRCALMVGYPKGERYPKNVYRPQPETVWLEES